jgi:hypothetical protein
MNKEIEGQGPGPRFSRSRANGHSFDYFDLATHWLNPNLAL